MTTPLDARSRHLRRVVVRMLRGARRGHVGSAYSVIDILRVLYDDDKVYVAFTCHDSQPDQIVRMLGDRDAPPVSDTVAEV